MKFNHQVLESNFNAQGLRCAIVASRFNQFLVEKLTEGALDALCRNGAKSEDQTLAWVPGAWEIPVVVKRLALSKKYDAIICVGVVLKGITSHFDYVAGEACKGIANISLETGVPVTMGIVTADTLTQAIERSGTTAGNYGWNAAMAAIEVANLFRQNN